jgi:hypothetical protein
MAKGAADIALDRQIATLRWLLFERSADIDVPAVTGTLGAALIERSVRDDDIADLADALAYLHEAVGAAAHHPDRGRWYWCLGSGYGRFARIRDSADDYGRAVHWLRQSIGEHDIDNEEYIGAVSLLPGFAWDRYGLLRHGRECGPEEAGAAVEWLVAMVTDPRLRAVDARQGAAADLVHGLALLERHGLRERRADLDAGITVLAASVPVVDPDLPLLGLAEAALADAYLTRAGLDGDLASVDLSLRAGRSAVERATDDDETVWAMAHANQALAYAMRWRAAHDRDDLDRAITHWHQLLCRLPRTQTDRWEAACCGELLRERAELDKDPAQARQAVLLLDRAADAAECDDTWLRRYELGRAYLTEWRLTRRPAALADARRSLDQARSSASGVDAVGDGGLAARLARIQAGYDALDAAARDLPFGV